jgi:hypothetical protein
MHKALALAFLFASLFAATAQAGGSPPGNLTVPLTIHPGLLTIKTLSLVSVRPENGGQRFQLRLKLTDARGSGAGWQLSLSAAGADAQLLQIHFSCAAHSTCTLPHGSTGTALLQAGTRAEIYRNDKDSGMGVMIITLTFDAASAPTLSPSVS